MEIIKVCSCGIEYTLPGWLSLEYVGIQKGVKHLGDLELRNCLCGSTIAIKKGERG